MHCTYKSTNMYIFGSKFLLFTQTYCITGATIRGEIFEGNIVGNLTKNLTVNCSIATMSTVAVGILFGTNKGGVQTNTR